MENEIMDKVIQIDLIRCMKAVLAKWWIVVLCSFVAFVGAYLYSYPARNNVYKASTTLYSVTDGSYESTVSAAYFLSTYADVITSRKVTEKAASLLGDNSITWQDIQNVIQVNYSSDSTIVEISAYSLDEDFAVKVANGVANAFISEISSMTGRNSVQLLDSAYSASVFKNASFEKFKIRCLATLAVMVITIMIIVLREIFGSKLYYIDDLRLEDDMEIIGIIPNHEK
jgi:capsular polysaccharide biosynthesis protein